MALLYAELERRTGPPVVRLNRAVAVTEAGSAEAGLALFDRALVLARTDAEREHLERRRSKVH
jgi:predicted RNA polymerase sigma factor